MSRPHPTRPPRGILLALLLALAGSDQRAARSEDAAPDAGLESRLYPVRALTRGVHPWFMDRCPVRSEPVLDEENPLFGGYGEIWRTPWGGASDLLAQLKASTGAGGTWEREGVVARPVGNDLLLLRAPAATHEAVATFLVHAAREAATCVYVEIVALAGDPAAVRRAGGVSAALASRAVRVLGVAARSVAPWIPSLLQVGSQRASLADVDVEVAQSSHATDPIVDVLQEGFACEVEGGPVSGGRVRLHARGWWAAPPTTTAYRTKGGDVLELSSQDGRTFDRTVEAGDGEWTVVLVGGGVSLAIRARAVRPGIRAEDAAGIRLFGSPSGTGDGPILERRWDVSDLEARVEHSRGADLYVPPSNYTPMEPPELPEAYPLVPFVDLLAPLIPVVLDPDTWSADGVGWRASRDTLTVRHDADRLGKIERMLGVLRARGARSARLTVSVVAPPPSELPAWRAAGDGDVSPDADLSLLRRSGARRLHSGSLLLRDGQWAGSFDGTRRAYVADFDVEIAQGSSIANPVVRELFDGTSVDVAASWLLGSNHVVVDARVARGVLREMRRATSIHGPIECPVYDRIRCGGTVVVPLGATRLLGAGLWGSDAVLVLVTVDSP